MGCEAYSYNLQKPENLLNEEATKASEDGMPVINTDMIDKCLSLAQENDLSMRFHTLVWYSQTLDWYFCENYVPEYDGAGTAKKTLQSLLNMREKLKKQQVHRQNGYEVQITELDFASKGVHSFETR